MVGSSWTYHRQDMGTNAEWHRAQDLNTTGWLGAARKEDDVVERRQDGGRRDVSHPDFGTADLRGMR